MNDKNDSEKCRLPHDHAGDVEIPARDEEEKRLPPRKHDHVTSRVPESPCEEANVEDATSEHEGETLPYDHAAAGSIRLADEEAKKTPLRRHDHVGGDLVQRQEDKEH